MQLPVQFDRPKTPAPTMMMVSGKFAVTEEGLRFCC